MHLVLILSIYDLKVINDKEKIKYFRYLLEFLSTITLIIELFPTLISLVAVTTLPTPGLVSTAKGRHVSWYLGRMHV